MTRLHDRFADAEASPPDHAPPSAVLFESDLVQVGSFRCPIGHPRFADSGPTRSFCFVFPRTSVWIQHEGSDAFVADPNVIPLYNRAHPYRRRAISADGDCTDWFGIAPGLLREMLHPGDPDAAADEHRLFRSGFAPATPRLYAKQRAVFTGIASHSQPSRLLIEESVIALLSHVVASIHGARPPPSGHRRQRAIVEAARAHLGETFTHDESLSQVAAAVGVSVFHLCRLFRRLTGRTMHAYRNQLRLHTALERLERTRGDILGVATELGYSGHSHFTAAFRAAFGVSPSQWRTAVPPVRAAATQLRAGSRGCLRR